MGESSTLKDKKIAIVHDWFITIGGAEKVLNQLLLTYPEADVFCVLDCFDSKQRSKILLNKETKSTYLNKIPLAKKYYRLLVPVFYKAIEKIDLKGYDIIISSSHSIAKNIITSNNQIHFCYCHTPIRYVWNMKKTYLEQLPLIIRKRAIKQIGKIKEWDFNHSKKISHFIANSHFVANRIQQNYKRNAVVIHPPVDNEFYQLPKDSTNKLYDTPFFLVVSRLVHYKKIGLIIEAFNKLPDEKLVVIGTGPQEKLWKTIANKNISFLGYQDSNTVKLHMQQAQAILMAAIEDFGITSLETQACGTPVIAFNYGGYKETIIHKETGILFNEQTSESIVQGIKDFYLYQHNFDPSKIRENANKFGNSRFRTEISDFIAQNLKST